MESIKICQKTSKGAIEKWELKGKLYLNDDLLEKKLPDVVLGGAGIAG